MMHKLLSTLMLLCLTAGSIKADGFDPQNPPEPSMTYRVTVTSDPADVAYLSGTGRYNYGEWVYINCSSRSERYTFKHWLKNGVEYTSSSDFYYEVEKADVEFVAVYEYVPFDPDSPSEPSLDLRYPLNLTCEPSTACSFSVSNGERHQPGEWIGLAAYPNQGYDFLGWYEGNTMICATLSFNYEMPNGRAALTARFRFNPQDPDEPGSTGAQSGIRGDVNGDDIVNATDAAIVIKKYLDGDTNTKYDINRDGVVNVTDATSVINIYLNE